MADKPDFSKVWASNSPLTEYTFSDSDYLEGWNFVGSTPPARGMFDALQKKNDEKMKYLEHEISSGGGSLARAAIYIYTSGTYTVPDGVTTLYVSGCAGGGGGSASYGGGGGESVKRKKITVTPGQQITVTIGAGGTCSNSAERAFSVPSASGGDGGNTVFGSFFTLVGGKGAQYGAGNRATQYPTRGGNGATSGGVAPLAYWGNGTSWLVWSGGKGGDSLFGTGGTGGYYDQGLASAQTWSTPANGTDGIGYGSGGGGCALATMSSTAKMSGAGNGASGLIIIELA